MLTLLTDTVPFEIGPAEKAAIGNAPAFDDIAIHTDAAGRFRIAALPGQGGLAVVAWGDEYIPAERRFVQGDGLFWTFDRFRTLWTRFYFSSAYAVAVVTVKPASPKDYALTLDTGGTRCRTGSRRAGLDPRPMNPKTSSSTKRD